MVVVQTAEKVGGKKVQGEIEVDKVQRENAGDARRGYKLFPTAANSK